MENIGPALLILTAVVVYLIPSGIAISKKHNKTFMICFINILAGWTIIGWVTSFIWSLCGNNNANNENK